MTETANTLSRCAMQFPRVQEPFHISAQIFDASDIPFAPKPGYVQQTLDYSQVLPLYNQVPPFPTG